MLWFQGRFYSFNTSSTKECIWPKHSFRIKSINQRILTNCIHVIHSRVCAWPGVHGSIVTPFFAGGRRQTGPGNEDGLFIAYNYKQRIATLIYLFNTAQALRLRRLATWMFPPGTRTFEFLKLLDLGDNKKLCSNEAPFLQERKSCLILWRQIPVSLVIHLIKLSGYTRGNVRASVWLIHYNYNYNYLYLVIIIIFIWSLFDIFMEFISRGAI